MPKLIERKQRQITLDSSNDYKPRSIVTITSTLSNSSVSTASTAALPSPGLSSATLSRGSISRLSSYNSLTNRLHRTNLANSNWSVDSKCSSSISLSRRISNSDLSRSKSSNSVWAKQDTTRNKNVTSSLSDVNPHTYLTLQLKLRGIDTTVQECLSMNDYFLKPTQEQIDGYTNEVVQAARACDVDALRSMHKSGLTMRLCNRFGESLIHMACRRGNAEMVSFLLDEADVSLRVRDDYGRTPLHDACWTSEPCFDVMKILMKKEPSLLFVSDKRGHTPLQYVRREHWVQWVSFLKDKHIMFEREKYEA
eukprot:CAMPEP_0172493128 /NCGR_PEP_ID=MMETSP1066-20121228/24478_1 /TAXON_ID=671091 /ORGANISM="Coscinodiscus wailesii, Strain CCMP2513" /LENGTH=308 /DNA_ID=CAMNT_0013263129 /DNA_START=277 /DNA_END=1203 /DNA_ORIENTATION=+